MSGARLTPKELLARLVEFDTTSANSNLDLVDFVEDYLGGHGIPSQRVPSEDGKKASLFATIGPDGASGIGLSAHTDVVPVKDQKWSSDPFMLTEREGKLYARGSCDMKGFIACILAFAPEFKRRKLKTPVHLLLSYDEEVGCTGCRPMIARLGKDLVRPKLVIVGEPTSMRVVDAHKGIHGFVTEVTGKEAHSSMQHLGVNAIAAAGEILCEINRITAEMRDRADGPRFEPPYTTVQVGVIQGGTAMNIVPKHCRLRWQYRPVPAADPEEIPRRVQAFIDRQVLPGLKAASPLAGVTTRRVSDVPALNAPKGSPAVSLALKLAEQNETFAVSYGTEGGLFEDAGVPAVICGPGDIAQAHAPDEYIDPGELDRCWRFLERLAEHVEQA
ncbi:MAG: acetylornithine deacetylase [Pseudomonadota bacterium]|nr:acetylornithine deacetylase [Pseudomonadota bacterium]